MAGFNGNLIDEAYLSSLQELNLLGERAILSALALFLLPLNQELLYLSEEKPFDISYLTLVTKVDTSLIKPAKITPTTSESMAIARQKLELNLPKSLPSQIIPRKSFGKFIKNNAETISNVSNIANGVFTSLAGERSEFSGARGDVAKGLDTAYDTILNVAGKLGPYGKIVQAGMAANKLVSNVVGKLGGGTDGMCVCAGTRVFKANGEAINIEELRLEDGIIGWNENTKQIIPQSIKNIIEPILKECLEIITKSGYTIRCSIDHPILSDTSPKAKSHRINGKSIAYRNWKFRRADELQVGNFIGVANNIDYWGTKNVNKAYLIGLLIGDGTYTKGNSCRLISSDKSTWDYIENNKLGIINHCDDTRKDKYQTEIRTYRIIDGMLLVRDAGIVYLKGTEKTLPTNIGLYNKESVCLLLAGLFDTDGSFSVNETTSNWSIALYQSNLKLLQLVKELLHKLGIFSGINTRKEATYLLGDRIINSKESYRLEVSDIASVIKFYNNIHLNIDYKLDNLDRIYNIIKNKTPKEHNVLSGAKLFKIVEIRNIGTLTVYNLQADPNHTYLANGIITHNTTVDAIMGSPFMQITPFGLVNGFGGKKADTITKNNEVFALVGSSYGGSNNTVDEALKKSGKKYGAFSSGARKEANQEIMEAKRLLNEIEDISNEATDLQDISNYMASINSDRLQFEMNGGYDLDSVRVGRVGFKMSKIHNIILKAQKGTKLIDPYQHFLSTLPHNLLNEDGEYRMKELWEWNGKPKDFKSALHLFSLVDGVFHAPSVSENPQGVLEFLKSPKHPSIHLEEEWYNSPEGAPFKERFELIKSEPYWKYVERTTPLKFLNGGAVNVIPEGALHARKNNMDIEGITKKGIPVVSEDGGKILQHAEIERNEVILRLEVTLKIEELSKVYYSESSTEEEKEKAALEAGKLLSDEIINNTLDNTGLINDESRLK